MGKSTDMRTFMLKFLCAFIIVRAVEAASCTQSYQCSTTCYRKKAYYTGCGLFWWERCSRYKSEGYTCSKTCYRTACCSGWTGSNCATPVCQQSCNHGRCVSPNTCSCSPGWTGTSCSADIDECRTSSHGCTQTCVNTAGSYYCSCRTGYNLTSDGKSCSDIDECTKNSHNCDRSNGYCHNTVGSFTCFCKSGFKMTSGDTNCLAVCFNSTSCANGGKCVSPDQCKCQTGYQTPKCDDIDECTKNSHNCDRSNGYCHNTVGSFTCFCNSGFRMTSGDTKCLDIDECSVNTGGCGYKCTNTAGSYYCTCKTGYQLVSDKKTCLLPGQSSEGFEVRNYRQYFLKAEKIEWDYLPYHQNLVDFNNEYINKTLVNGPDRVGSRYSKYVYKRYKDGNFTELMQNSPSLGYVGPLIHGEVGEVIQVHFRNALDRPVSVHPHGVKYDKLNEGALYIDKTNQSFKVDDGVQPGGQVTMTWKMTSNFAPRDDDPACVPFAYHSHVDSDREVNSGLLGLLVVCKPGTLNEKNERTDVDKEFVLYFDSINEGESWLVDENLQRCGDPAECKRLFASGDPDFEESLLKDSINGYTYGNLPDMTVCEGDKIAWYIFSLNAELHPVNIHGQTFIENHHRTSVIGVWSATFRAAEMVARNPGTWLVQCMNSEHNRNGMKVFLTVKSCYGSTPAKDQLSGKVRQYFLAAELEDWDYAPSGKNLYDGTSLTTPGSHSELYFAKTYNGKKLIGGAYKKSRFIEYSSVWYTTKKTRSQREQHLGLLGPILRAEVGDTIRIYLKNLTPQPVSIVLQGTSVNKSQDGAWIKEPFSTKGVGHIVNPRDTKAYVFTIPWAVAPGTDDPDCMIYMYYSNYNMERDVSSGLVGPLLICKPGSLDAYSGRQKYVDREMFLYISSIDENFSWYIDDNIAKHIGEKVDSSDEDFVESNVMRSINGRSYGNLEGLDVCWNERVVWHIISFGQTEGNHGVTFNGNNVIINGVNRDSHVIISGMGYSAVMNAQNAGNWSIYCHNNVHYEAGMKAIYRVNACGQITSDFYQKSGVTRRYYIGAVERKWDYSPKTIHPFTSENYSDPSHPQYNRVQKDGLYIGSIYTKALYREFTDAKFAVGKPITAETLHLGVLGPFIKAEVGDVIEVVFKNMASRSYSIHPQGLRYNKTFEGMKYADGTPVKVGDGVPPGTTFTYRWEVPEASGPGPNGPNCVNFMYHSAVDPVKDTYSGLVGPIVICRQGVLNFNGTRKDSVEREFALFFQAFDENKSWYLAKNIQENCPSADTSTAEFEESNKYDSINGLIYNNVQGLVAKTGDNIAWYVMALGENEDIHTAHFHGQTHTYRGGQSHRGDVVEVFPGTYETVEMFADNPGTWLVHCHVGQHTRDGMVATYTIT